GIAINPNPKNDAFSGSLNKVNAPVYTSNKEEPSVANPFASSFSVFNVSLRIDFPSFTHSTSSLEEVSPINTSSFILPPHIVCLRPNHRVADGSYLDGYLYKTI